MRILKYGAVVGILLIVGSLAQAQVAVGVRVGSGYYAYDDLGPPPGCAYGYYAYYPYACAPYGYYGPDYFIGGIFIGVGPWYRNHDRGYWPGYHGRGYYGRGYYARGYDARIYGYGRDYYGSEGHRGGYSGGQDYGAGRGYHGRVVGYDGGGGHGGRR